MVFLLAGLPSGSASIAVEIPPVYPTDAFRKMEFQKSLSPLRCPVNFIACQFIAYPGGANILRVRPIRRALGGDRLKETCGDRLAQTAIINRAVVPFRFHVFFALDDGDRARERLGRR